MPEKCFCSDSNKKLFRMWRKSMQSCKLDHKDLVQDNDVIRVCAAINILWHGHGGARAKFNQVFGRYKGCKQF